MVMSGLTLSPGAHLLGQVFLSQLEASGQLHQ